MASGGYTLVDQYGSPILTSGDKSIYALQVADVVNGGLAGTNNPYPSADQIRLWIANGQGFYATSGKATAGANAAGQFLVTNAGKKTVILFSTRVAYTNANAMHDTRIITTLDANITTAMTIGNLMVGGGNPQAAVSASYTTADAGGATGTAFEGLLTGQNSMADSMVSGVMALIIPPGTAGGLAVYMATTAAGQFSITYRWVEV